MTEVTEQYIRDRARKASREFGKEDGWSPERTERARQTMIRRATNAAKKHGYFVEGK